PVLDMAFNTSYNTSLFEGNLANQSGQTQGLYAGTRVVTVSKLIVYNGTALVFDQPPTCTSANPVSCTAINLPANAFTGTLTPLGIVSPLDRCAANAPAAGFLPCAPTVNGGVINNPVPPIFWEPDNVRGRVLASFNAQVAGPYPTNLVSGVVTPF